MAPKLILKDKCFIIPDPARTKRKVLYDALVGTVWELNPSAEFLVGKLLGSAWSEDELVSEVVKGFQCSEEEARADVRAFLIVLKNLNLVDEVTEASP